jgi:type III secretion protein L
MESVEGKMAEIVLTALKSFMVEVGDREMVVQIVRKTMNAVIRTQRQVTLKVAPELVETVRARVAEFRTAYPTVENFDVVEDPRLKGPACILETEAGVADASVDTQLAAIEKSIRRHIDKGA